MLIPLATPATNAFMELGSFWCPHVGGCVVVLPTCLNREGMAQVEDSLLPVSGLFLWASAHVHRAGHVLKRHIKETHQSLQREGTACYKLVS